MERDDARYNWSAKLITSTGRIISFFIINECAGYRDRCATLVMQEDLFFRYLIHAFVPRLIQRMLRQLFDHFNSKKEKIIITKQERMMEDEKLDRVFDEFFIGKFEEKDEEKGDTRFNKRKIIIKLI